MGLLDRFWKLVGVETKQERWDRQLDELERAEDIMRAEFYASYDPEAYRAVAEWEEQRELDRLERGSYLLEVEGIAKAEEKLREAEQGNGSDSRQSEIEDLLEHRRDVDGSGLTSAERDRYYIELEGVESSKYRYSDSKDAEFAMEFHAADIDNARGMILESFVEILTGDKLTDDKGNTFVFDGNDFVRSSREGPTREQMEVVSEHIRDVIGRNYIEGEGDQCSCWFQPEGGGPVGMALFQGEPIGTPEPFADLPSKAKAELLVTCVGWDGFTVDQRREVSGRVISGESQQFWFGGIDLEVTANNDRSVRPLTEQLIEPPDGLGPDETRALFAEMRADEHAARVRDYGDAVAPDTEKILHSTPSSQPQKEQKAPEKSRDDYEREM